MFQGREWTVLIDARLTALAAFDKGLKHVNAMEDGSLIGGAPTTSEFLIDVSTGRSISGVRK